jgi:hypothetical protein
VFVFLRLRGSSAAVVPRGVPGLRSEVGGDVVLVVLAVVATAAAAPAPAPGALLLLLLPPPGKSGDG